MLIPMAAKDTIAGKHGSSTMVAMRATVEAWAAEQDSKPSTSHLAHPAQLGLFPTIWWHKALAT